MSRYAANLWKRAVQDNYRLDKHGDPVVVEYCAGNIDTIKRTAYYNNSETTLNENDPVVRWYTVYAGKTPVLIGIYRKSGEFQAIPHNKTLYRALSLLIDTREIEWEVRKFELSENKVAFEWTHPDVFMTKV